MDRIWFARQAVKAACAKDLTGWDRIEYLVILAIGDRGQGADGRAAVARIRRELDTAAGDEPDAVLELRWKARQLPDSQLHSLINGE